jgi:signal transduction histidine kinase
MGAVERVRALLPEGGGLPDDVWERRHRAIVALLWANAIGLAAFGLIQGYGVIHALSESGIVAVAALAAWSFRKSHSAGSVIATLGLMTASGILVHFSQGSIEAHFHFFVMVTIIILYQDWLPFLLAIAYVVAHHALFGLIDPSAVFNHPAALANPVKWAIIHGLFILGASVAGLTVWKQNERLRSSYQEAAVRLAEAESHQREALELNDNVLQNLVIAEFAFEMGMDDRGRKAMKKSLSETQKIVSELLEKSVEEVEPGDLVRATGVTEASA